MFFELCNKLIYIIQQGVIRFEVSTQDKLSEFHLYNILFVLYFLYLKKKYLFL